MIRIRTLIFSRLKFSDPSVKLKLAKMGKPSSSRRDPIFGQIFRIFLKNRILLQLLTICSTGILKNNPPLIQYFSLHV